MAGTYVTRAVVLGAGGPAGIAWEVGIMAGLADVGIDVREADLLIGTSAGSIVAAGLASRQGFEELFAQQVDPRARSASSGRRWNSAGCGTISQQRRRVGARSVRSCSA